MKNKKWFVDLNMCHTGISEDADAIVDYIEKSVDKLIIGEKRLHRFQFRIKEKVGQINGNIHSKQLKMDFVYYDNGDIGLTIKKTGRIAIDLMIAKVKGEIK